MRGVLKIFILSPPRVILPLPWRERVRVRGKMISSSPSP
jgi:hypothetical protein